MLHWDSAMRLNAAVGDRLRTVHPESTLSPNLLRFNLVYNYNFHRVDNVFAGLLQRELLYM